MRSSRVFTFTMPSLVFEDMGMRWNCKPSLFMACIMLRLKRRLVPSNFSSMASSSLLVFADQEAMA